MIDLEFLNRATDFYKKDVENYLETRRQKINKWNWDNPEKLKKSQRKYEKTEKGKRAGKRRSALRKRRETDGIEKLSALEKAQIAEFYRNCPPGHEVDHIIPLSKGGKHILVNLQYLTKEENRKKGSKILTMYKCDFNASWAE